MQTDASFLPHLNTVLAKTEQVNTKLAAAGENGIQVWRETIKASSYASGATYTVAGPGASLMVQVLEGEVGGLVNTSVGKARIVEGHANGVYSKFRARCNLDPDTPLAYGLLTDPITDAEILSGFAESFNATYLNDKEVWIKPNNMSWADYSKTVLNVANDTRRTVHFNMEKIDLDAAFRGIGNPNIVDSVTSQELRHIRDNWDNGFSEIVKWHWKSGAKVETPPWLWPWPPPP